MAIKSGLNDAEAQEVVQETIITVAKKMPGFKYDPALGSFKGWLLHITRWRINDQLRKQQKENERHGAAQGDTTTTVIKRIPDPASFDLDAVWEQDWEQNLIEAALDRVKRGVNPKQYQMFDLHVVKEWPARKVAQKLHTSLPQVYYAKYKIAALIRKEIRNLERKGL